jgi:hypothetical protein
MFKHLWQHCREIRVSVFHNKVIYTIPLYSDLLFKNYKLEYKDESIILTTFKEGTIGNSKETSTDSIKSCVGFLK